LLALRDRALLGQTADGRYTLHELVRQYAAEQAATQPMEAAEAEARHARYYAALVEREGTAFWTTAQAQKTFGAEIDNMQAAWAWAAAQGECSLLAQMRAGLLAWYWANSQLPDWAAQLQPAAARVRAALSLGGAPAPERQLLLGSLLTDEASMLIMAGQVERAQQLLDGAEALSGDLPAPQAPQAAIAHWRGRIGYLQRNVPAAQHQSEQARALARIAGARDLEAYSLWQLGRLAVMRNDCAAARPYLEQALALFQAQGDRLGEAFVTHELGTSAFEQGHMTVAQRCFDEVLRFCQTFGCRSCVPFACTGLGLVYDQGLGRHTDAEPYFAEALALWRATGFRPNDESCLLAYQGRSALAQGDQPRAQALFTQALSTARAAGELSAAVGRIWALHGLGLLAHYTSDEREAEQLAHQALRIARQSWQPRAARFALRLLGHALFGQGKLAQAQSTYRQVLESDQTLGYPHLAVEATADLARVALAQGSIAQAVAHAAGILADLQTDALNGAEEPVLVYLTCYQVLRVAGDPRAEAVLTAGYSLLIERATQFVDDARKAWFLDNLPAHRTLLHAWRDDSRWTMGAGEHDADASLPPRAFDNRQRTPLHIVRREESS
jgi:tetratricopeptide (TPR) repeat protein